MCIVYVYVYAYASSIMHLLSCVKGSEFTICCCVNIKGSFSGLDENPFENSSINSY